MDSLVDDICHLIVDHIEGPRMLIVSHRWYNFTALHPKHIDNMAIGAVISNNLVGLKYFKDNGANVHAENYRTLALATTYGHLNIVKFLVDNGANIHLTLPIKTAIQNGHYVIVQYLLDMGADVNIMQHSINSFIYPIENYNVLLHTAIKAHNLDMVKLLVEYGASVSHVLMKKIIEFNYFDIFSYLLPIVEDKQSALKYACEHGTLQYVKLCHDMGIRHELALDYAIEEGHLNIVKYLVEHAHYVIFNTAYLLAKKIKRTDIMQYLKSKGIHSHMYI